MCTGIWCLSLSFSLRNSLSKLLGSSCGYVLFLSLFLSDYSFVLSRIVCLYLYFSFSFFLSSYYIFLFFPPISSSCPICFPFTIQFIVLSVVFLRFSLIKIFSINLWLLLTVALIAMMVVWSTSIAVIKKEREAEYIFSFLTIFLREFKVKTKIYIWVNACGFVLVYITQTKL